MTQNYTITISAPIKTVWDTMLTDETYRQWTAAFHPGSYFEGSWDQGSSIQFLSKDDGKLSGMFARIAENEQYEFISIEHLGEVVDGKENPDSAMSKAVNGSFENYTFTETDGVTTVIVTLESETMPKNMVKMFDGMWPPALAKLKELAEKA